MGTLKDECLASFMCGLKPMEADELLKVTARMQGEIWDLKRALEDIFGMTQNSPVDCDKLPALIAKRVRLAIDDEDQT